LDLTRAVWTTHARLQVVARGLAESDVESVLRVPSAIRAVRAGRVVVQAEKEIAGRLYLLRVFVDVDREPNEIVTAYRTSKIERYRGEP